MLNVLLFCSDSGEPICVAQNHWDALALNERIEWRCHHRERAREEKCKTKQMKENRKRKEIGENVRRRYAINNKIDLLPFFRVLALFCFKKLREQSVCANAPNALCARCKFGEHIAVDAYRQPPYIVWADAFLFRCLWSGLRPATLPYFNVFFAVSFASDFVFLLRFSFIRFHMFFVSGAGCTVRAFARRSCSLARFHLLHFVCL